MIPQDMAANKQKVNKVIVEKLRSKLDFRFVKQCSMFLHKSVNVITLFNNLHAVICEIRGFPTYMSP